MQRRTNDVSQPHVWSGQPAPMFIAGKRAESDTVKESVNPATGLVVGTYYDSGEAQAREAADAAAKALANTEWSRRQDLACRRTREIGRPIVARIPDLAAMLSQE